MVDHNGHDIEYICAHVTSTAHSGMHKLKINNNLLIVLRPCHYTAFTSDAY